MDAEVLTIPTLTTSSIKFYCDLSCPDAAVIPLGFMGEIVSGDLRGLVMVARKELSDDDKRVIGEPGAKILANPFEYLAVLFDEAWDKAQPGTALEYLSARHGHSINFSTPLVQSIEPLEPQVDPFGILPPLIKNIAPQAHQIRPFAVLQEAA